MPVRSRIEIFGIPIPKSSRVIPPQEASFPVLEEDDAYAQLHKESYPLYRLTLITPDKITLVRDGTLQRRTRQDINIDTLWIPNRRGNEGTIVRRRIYWSHK